MFWIAGSAAFGSSYHFYQVDSGFFWIWLLFVGVLMLSLFALIVEYALTIVSSTADSEPPPILRLAKLATMALVPRAYKQIVLTLMFLTAGHQLVAQDNSVGWIVWGYLFLTFPATVIVNALSEELLEMLNPLRLIRSAWYSGVYYPGALAVLTMAILLASQLFDGNIILFLLIYPCLIYLMFLFVHLLGLGIAVHRDMFYPPVDFNAEREAQEARNKASQGFLALLSAAHEDVRAGKKREAMHRIIECLDAQQWRNFDLVFTYLKDWSFPDPALHIAGRQIVLLTGRQQFMQALTLAEWVTQQRDDFLIDDVETLRALGQHAATRPQCLAMLTLLENFLKLDPVVGAHIELATLCLELAGTRLRDEKRYLALKQIFVVSAQAGTHNGDVAP